MASAFDAKNRRVYKSFFDETTLQTSVWFFYYDAVDRLVEIRYTPDVSVSTTYQIWQLLWLGNRLTAYWQTDYPSATTSKRYVGTDETGRPVDMINWPNSGNCNRVWSLNPDAWGNDTLLVGSSLFQPILFAGQYTDQETTAWLDDGATPHRSALALNGFRTYDSGVGAYLQVDPLVDETWNTYGYVDSNPVGRSDPDGLKWGGGGTTSPEYVLVEGKAPDVCWDAGGCFPGGEPNPYPLPEAPPDWWPGGGGGGGEEEPAGSFCDGQKDVAKSSDPKNKWGCKKITCQVSGGSPGETQTGYSDYAYASKESAYQKAVFQACLFVHTGRQVVSCTGKDDCTNGPTPGAERLIIDFVPKR